MDQIFDVVESLIGGIALVWISAATALLVSIVYLLARAHNMGTIRFSVAGLQLVFSRVVALAMVLIVFVATVNILTAALSLLVGDSFAYGGGSDVDEFEELARWVVYGALAVAIYLFMLLQARKLAGAAPARFVRTAYVTVASGIFCLTSIVYTFRLAGAIIDAAIESGGIFERSPSIGQPLVILATAVAFFFLTGYLARKGERV